MRWVTLYAIPLFLAAACCGRLPAMAGEAPGNLVRNGAFEDDTDSDGVPDGWTVSGRRDIKQQLDPIFELVHEKERLHAPGVVQQRGEL